MDIANKLIAFYNHLNAADVNRTIFSVKLGERNSEFIKSLKKSITNTHFIRLRLLITRLQ